MSGFWGMLADMAVPVILCGVALWGMHQKVDVYTALLRGAGQGLDTMLRIFPALVGLLTAVSMLRASGALDVASEMLSPVLERLGLPHQLLPLMLIRPISGSAALGVGAELIGQYGPDSLLGRTAAVMLGSTETTFYTIAVYYGSVGINKVRHTIKSALIADFTGIILSVIFTSMLLGR